MTDESGTQRRQRTPAGGGGLVGGVYGLGFIGAAIYFIQHAHSFLQGVVGLLEALVWPAILVYKLLEHMST